MMQDEPNLSLFEVSSRLGVSPSAIKKRVAQLGLPVQRGARGKLIFDRHAYALLVEADQMLKAGQGFEECRRKLGLNGPAPLVVLEAPEPTADFPAPVLAAPDEGVRPLAPPIFLQLGRKRAAHTPPPDLLARVDSALKMLEEKERHNQMLQAKLLVAYDEMTKLSATAAAFQERSLNLAHEVQKLQGELKLLEAPGKRRPWWRFWG
ncbi:MAG: hypothetical protein JWM80_1759 [Cyanobacteria bacterium RYN_339]|nr:hypothetical protein [Cyanobacteria bacterium RYN_339]